MKKDIRTTTDVIFLREELERYKNLKDAQNVAVIEWRLKQMGQL